MASCTHSDHGKLDLIAVRWKMDMSASVLPTSREQWLDFQTSMDDESLMKVFMEIWCWYDVVMMMMMHDDDDDDDDSFPELIFSWEDWKSLEHSSRNTWKTPQ